MVFAIKSCAPLDEPNRIISFAFVHQECLVTFGRLEYALYCTITHKRVYLLKTIVKQIEICVLKIVSFKTENK